MTRVENTKYEKLRKIKERKKYKNIKVLIPEESSRDSSSIIDEAKQPRQNINHKQRIHPKCGSLMKISHKRFFITLMQTTPENNQISVINYNYNIGRTNSKTRFEYETKMKRGEDI